MKYLSTHHCLVKFHKARLSMIVYDDHASNHAAEAGVVPAVCPSKEAKEEPR